MEIVTLIALALALSLVSSAQNAGQSGSQASPDSQNQARTSNPSQNMSGTVSHDGKKVTSDKNNKSYKVDNPDSLKGKEDQHVALLVAVDPDQNVVHIIEIEPPQQ